MAGLLARIGEFAWAQVNSFFLSGLACVSSREELGELIRRLRHDGGGAGVARAVPDDWLALYANWDAERNERPWGQDAIRLREGEVAALLRDTAGNPFRPVSADPTGLTAAAVGLAQTIYADRAFDRLPILADALEEAGCDNADVLAHCRGGGPHVRGCWVVDLVLGKR
jgi:hypothetical protein